MSDDKKKGTYAGVKFSGKTTENIEHYLKENDVPNSVPADKLHTTLLYSRKYLPTFKSEGPLKSVIVGIPDKFDIWKSQDGKKCLVLLYKCNTLEIGRAHV